MRKWTMVAVLLAVGFSGLAIGYFLNPVGVPPLTGYMEGKEIRFVITESSDRQVAERMTKRMGSGVLYVRSLAKIPEDSVGKVYVFKNGVIGKGPFGYQVNVFDSPPGTPGYSPLRSMVLVTWKNPQARELKSAAEVEEALNKGEITAEQVAVCNVPLLTWPGGRR